MNHTLRKTFAVASLLLLVVASVSACDSDHDKAWRTVSSPAHFYSLQQCLDNPYMEKALCYTWADQVAKIDADNAAESRFTGLRGTLNSAWFLVTHPEVAKMFFRKTAPQEDRP